MNRIVTTINSATSIFKESFNAVKENVLMSLASNIPNSYLDKRIKSISDKRIKETIQNEQEDSSWHRITDQARTRDLTPLKHDKMIKVVDWLYERNPIAKKILGLITDFVIGKGITIKADKVKGKEDQQEKVQEIIDRWWKSNEWALKQFDKIEELSKYGEQAYLVDINPMNGDMITNSMPPETIKKVLVDEKFPEQLDKICFYSKANVEGKEKLIIRERSEKEKDETTDQEIKIDEKLQGEAFYFTVNRGTFGTRGKSDILSIADWLDIYDRTLYTMTERVVFLLSFIWDITINGATEEELKKRRDELEKNPVQAGGALFHNEMETWEPKNPDLKGADFMEYSKTVQGMLSGGSGFPVHWLFGQGETVNKASAKEMSEPTIRKMLRRQEYVNAMFRQMVDFLIQQKINKGILPKNTLVSDYPYSVLIPTPSQKEAGVIAESFATMIPALTIATDNEFLSNETAGEIVTMFVNQIGLDKKPGEEMEKAKSNHDKDIEKNIEKVSEALKVYAEKINKTKKS